MREYTVEIVCGDRVHNYNGTNGTYEVIFPNGNGSYLLGFFPNDNKSAPIADVYAWDFIPNGENRFYRSYECLADAERAIDEFERRLERFTA